MASASLELPHRVIVGGAAGGIGGAVSRKLRDAGVSVVGTDRGQRPDGWKGSWITADIADEAGRCSLAGQIDGPIDGVILAAGVLDPSDWQTISSEDAMRLLAVNLVAPFFIIRGLVPKMVSGASVVVVGSVAGFRASPGTPFYAASKAGLRNLAGSLALLLQPRGIRVNVVAPGLIDTPLTDALNADLAGRQNTTVDKVRDDRAAAIPMGRPGSADEVADACLYLLSKQSSYADGSTLSLTGGVLAGIV